MTANPGPTPDAVPIGSVALRIVAGLRRTLDAGKKTAAGDRSEIPHVGKQQENRS